MSHPVSVIEYARARARRSRVCKSATLMAESVSGVLSAPVLLDFSRTIQELIKDLKPVILQAPKTNNKLIQKGLADIETISLQVEVVREILLVVMITDLEGPLANFMWELQVLEDFLEASKKRLEVLQGQSYGEKLTNQHEITEELSRYEQELANGRALLN
ncbi:hypothetical protein RhiJN_28893 [Ceratobasidium sp. AG-Ba]|nr:hypothetical protein RhiJN_28893 [Ceratobasidium sp. AG-Ba]